MSENLYQSCSRCVMDTTAAGITFDRLGHCNYCDEFTHRWLPSLRLGEAEGGVTDAVSDLVNAIKRHGRGQRYDCVVGVSGGVDSSWVLVQAVRYGLRPLAVHMDNGWNTELAQNNISNLVSALGVDLYTHVIEWEEYRRAMLALLAADVLDVELLYDNAMLAVNYQAAKTHGVKYILAGTNTATEGMRMPDGWNWYKYDKKNILAIMRAHGFPKPHSFPMISTIGWLVSRYIRRIHWVSFLDHIGYDRNAVVDTLAIEYGYKPYPYKHYESVFTRFYQGFLLPSKFGVDKRRLHLSNLILTGQLSRDEATALLENIAYPDYDALYKDRDYFLKKIGWEPHELDAYIERPPVPHANYPSEKWLFDRLARFRRRALRWWSDRTESS